MPGLNTHSKATELLRGNSAANPIQKYRDFIQEAALMTFDGVVTAP